MSKKALISYYSLTGNTRHIAEQINNHVDGVLHEIQLETDYPQNNNAVVEQAKKEINEGFKPALKSKLDDGIDFDVLFIGSPNWWHTIAPPVSSFLEGLNLDGKIVVPFITHGGGGLEKCVDAIQQLCPNADIREPLSIYGKGTGNTDDSIQKWLNRQNL
jgi:flavodoxin